MVKKFGKYELLNEKNDGFATFYKIIYVLGYFLRCTEVFLSVSKWCKYFSDGIGKLLWAMVLNGNRPLLVEKLGNSNNRHIAILPSVRALI